LSGGRGSYPQKTEDKRDRDPHSYTSKNKKEKRE